MRDKHTLRPEALRQSLENRLNRVEGQVRGVKRMLAEDAYCIDILHQVNAIRAALNSFSKELLERHLRTCVKVSISQGDDAVIDELVDTFQRFVK